MNAKKTNQGTTTAEPTVYDHRRENLRNLVNAWKGPLALAKKLGYANAAFIVQMAGPNPTRLVSERTARMIEASLDLGREYMDRRPSAVEEVEMNTDLLHECVRVVTQVCEDEKVKFSPGKFADLVTLAYTEAVANGGNLKLDQLKKIIKFAT